MLEPAQSQSSSGGIVANLMPKNAPSIFDGLKATRGTKSLSSGKPVSVDSNFGSQALAAKFQYESVGKQLRFQNVERLMRDHAAGPTENSFESLNDIMNIQVNEEDLEEVFGSNRHMYANLLGELLNNLLCLDPVAPSNPENVPAKSVNKSKVVINNGQRKLARGLKILKTITPKSMFKSGGLSPLPKPNRS